MRTRHLRLVSSAHSDTTNNRESVLSPYGPVRADSTTWRVREIHRANQDQQLTELLNSLENIVANLNYKSFEVYDTLNIAIEAVSAAVSATQTESAGTE